MFSHTPYLRHTHTDGKHVQRQLSRNDFKSLSQIGFKLISNSRRRLHDTCASVHVWSVCSVMHVCVCLCLEGMCVCVAWFRKLGRNDIVDISSSDINTSLANCMSLSFCIIVSFELSVHLFLTFQ